MRYVIAIGGNALLKKGEVQTADLLRQNAAVAVKEIATLALEHEVIVVHGNGPQVGLLALQSNDPFDVLDAETQGLIGYVLQQSLDNHLQNKKVAVTLLTQVEVLANDPAFQHPTKPIGAYYDESEKNNLAQEKQWCFVQRDQQFRRVVASPKPCKIIELNAILQLVQSGNMVIAAGGGGIPCISVDNQLKGVEAVIDKDLTAARLALDLHADQLIILTDVDGVYRNWNTSEQTLIHQAHHRDFSSQTFESGSMAPKIEAACEFVQQSGRQASIGHLNQLTTILAGVSGTMIF